MIRSPGVRAALLLSWVLVGIGAGSAWAHEFRPATLSLSERAPGIFAVRWTSDGAPGKGALRPVLPEHCVTITPVEERAYQLETGVVSVEVWTVACGPRGLVGATVGVMGLGQSAGSVFLRVRFLDRVETSALLHTGAPSARIGRGIERHTERATPGRVFASHVRLGVAHIALGVDHLLFVLALVLLVGARARPLFITITSFTLAHSITLGAAALGWVRVSPAPVEILIALSIAWVAFEKVRDQPSVLARAPWLAAFAFGLLHGLGFAGALAELGLPDGQIPLALLGFNLGVELGQLVFVLGLLGLLGLHQLARRRFADGAPQALAGQAPRIMAHLIGGVACYFALDRIVFMCSRGF